MIFLNNWFIFMLVHLEHLFIEEIDWFYYFVFVLSYRLINLWLLWLSKNKKSISLFLLNMHVIQINCKLILIFTHFYLKVDIIIQFVHKKTSAKLTFVHISDPRDISSTHLSSLSNNVLLRFIFCGYGVHSIYRESFSPIVHDWRIIT